MRAKLSVEAWLQCRIRPLRGGLYHSVEGNPLFRRAVRPLSHRGDHWRLFGGEAEGGVWRLLGPNWGFEGLGPFLQKGLLFIPRLY